MKVNKGSMERVVNLHPFDSLGERQQFVATLEIDYDRLYRLAQRAAWSKGQRTQAMRGAIVLKVRPFKPGSGA